MFWKKKKIPEKDEKLAEILWVCRKAIDQYGTLLNYGEISQIEYEVRIAPYLRMLHEEEIRKGLANQEAVDYLKEIFDTQYNEDVHKAIEEVYEDDKDTV